MRSPRGRLWLLTALLTLAAPVLMAPATGECPSCVGDSGVTDAGSDLDAASGTDAGSDGTGAGRALDGTDPGCVCVTTTAHGTLTPGVLLGFLGLLLRRRRTSGSGPII